MFSVWASVVVLFVAAFGAHSYPFDDDPVGKAKRFISEFDTYLEDNNLSEFQLPNIGILPIDPVKLRNGKFGKFSTLESHGEPTVQETKNADGSSTFQFDLKLGLKELNIHYDFFVNIFRLYKKEGNITITTKLNELEAVGVVVQSDEYCDATLYSVKYLKYEDFKIEFQPTDFPHLAEVSKTIMNYITPKILTITNAVLKGALFYPGFQNKFSEFVCKHWPHQS